MKNKIKILHLTKGTELYGAQRVILNLVENTSSESFDSSIATLVSNRHTRGIFIEEIKKRGGKAITIECEKRIDINALQQLIYILKKNNFDILHCHEIKSRIYGLIAARVLKLPTVTTNHLWLRASWLVKNLEYLDAFYIRFFDHIVAVSEEIRQSMLKFKIPATRMSVIINGINLTEFDSNDNQVVDIKKNLGLKEGIKVVGNVARLSIEKGHKLFLKAAQLIQKDFPDSYFLIVGNGPLEKELKFYADNLGISDKVLFTGFCPNIKDFYSVMDIYLLTSSREGTPMAMMEAMAMGVPVVATDVGGIGRIIHHNKNGILLKSNDPWEIAEIILTLLRNPGELTRLASNAKMTIQQEYSALKMIRQYENIYMRLLGNKIIGKIEL